jgi:hypothetical protein
MKLRIKGSSLRLRLTRSEVARLDAQGETAERVDFGAGHALVYKLCADRENKEITASYIDNIIEIRIPWQALGSWARSEQVGLSHQVPIATGELKILIEKDFACLAPRADEEESEHYTHPDAGSGKSC